MEDYSENPKRLHDVPLHVCKGCGKCYSKEKNMNAEDLLKQYLRSPESFKEGVCARPEVLKALEEEANLERQIYKDSGE